MMVAVKQKMDLLCTIDGVCDEQFMIAIHVPSHLIAGFANGDESLYPFSFPNGGTIEFNGSVPSGESMEVFFKFEANP